VGSVSMRLAKWGEVEDAESLLAAGVCAQEAEGDLIAGRSWFDAAYRVARDSGDTQVMAKAALGFAGLWVQEHRSAAASGLVRARLRESLRLIDPTCSVALRLRVRLAAECDYRAGRYFAVLAVLDEARLSPDPVVRAEALSLAHNCLLGPDHGCRRRALADEMVGEARLQMGLLWQVIDAFLAADPYAERRLRELRGSGGHLAIEYVADAISVMLAIRAGRLAEAEHLARQCLERGTKAGHPDAAAWYGAQLVAIRWYQGRLPELLPMLTASVDSPTLSELDNSLFAALAVASATAGDHRTAERLLATLRGSLPRSTNWLVTMFGIVETAHLLGNVHASARAYEMLVPFADLPMMAGFAVACFGSVHHALGVASLTMGEVDRAVDHLREAVHRDLALGHWPAVIASRRRYAQALTLRGDSAAAQSQLAQAEEVAASLGISGVSSGRAKCTRQDRRWRIELGPRTALVDHSVGMLHLAVLLANPDVEIAAVDLVAGLDPQAQAARTASPQPVLDRTAIQRYRQRLVELRDEIDRLDAEGNTDTSAPARVERDWVLAELGASTGLSGRPRAFADEQERARLAVGKAIRRALTHIERADATVGAHLRAAVHTGIRCWYRPATTP
jgi:tetratricopeptide (TPR) repeat protein